MVRGVRKSTVGTTQTAITIIELARNSVPRVVPIAGIRHRLELELDAAHPWELIIRVDVVVLVTVLALVQ